MTFYNNLKVLEVENSSICNAQCPHCMREELSDTKDWFEETFLPVEFFDTIPQDIYDNLDKIHFGGTLGDPCSAPNFIDVVKKVKSKNPNIRLTISTNGGMKSAEWWKKLALALDHRDRVQFAIDGLEDTNHIYRVNVNWNNLIRNARYFIDNGGKAGWQYIVFRHNEHQIKEAEALAKEYGFSEFILKKPHRFPISEIKGIKIVNPNNVAIEPPLNPDFASEIKMMPNLSKWRDETKQLKVNCDAQLEQSAYIDALGRLFPCCYTAAAVYQYQTATGKLVNDKWDEIWNAHGNDKINLNHTAWNDVVNGEFYNQLQQRWEGTDRIALCVLYCGANAKSSFPTVTSFQ